MNKKKKRPNNNRKWLWRIILVLLICVCVGVIAFIGIVTMAIEGLAVMSGSNSGCSTEDSAPFEGYARVTLPEDYSNFWSSCGGMQGWWAEAQFDIDPNDLDEFLETTNIDMPLSSEPLPSRIYVANASSIKARDNLLYGLYDTVDWLEEIVVDTNDPDRWTVYFTVLGG